MKREFVPFNADVIRKEFDSLPSKDADKLAALVLHYQEVGTSNPAPAQVDDYGDGLYRLRHVKAAYNGRILFFAAERSVGLERLVILSVYKKEGQKAPTQIIETARRRQREWESKRKGK